MQFQGRFLKGKTYPKKRIHIFHESFKIFNSRLSNSSFWKEGVENGVKFWEVQPNEKWQLKSFHLKGFKDMLGWNMKTYGFRVFDFHQSDTQSIKKKLGFNFLFSTKYRPHKQGLCLIFKQFWTWYVGYK